MERDGIEALIVALPETAGSALYGMVDVLAATGTLWRTLVGEAPGCGLIRPRIVGLSRQPFTGGDGIPVQPEIAVGDDPAAPIVILPELWLDPDDPMHGRHPELQDWIRRRHRSGSTLYSACTGAILLAATGLLQGRDVTSHWVFADLFRRHHPDVRFHPEPSLCFADATGSTLIDHVQNLRIEAAKRLVETGDLVGDEIAAEVGYENPAFFRRLFKRGTGLAPGQYRRMFQPLANAAELLDGPKASVA